MLSINIYHTILPLLAIIAWFLGALIYRASVNFPLILTQQWRDQCVEFLNLSPGDLPSLPDGPISPPSLLSKTEKNTRKTITQVVTVICFVVVTYLFLLPADAYLLPYTESIDNKLSLEGALYLAPLLLLISGLILLWLIDFTHQLLPDEIVMPLFWLGIFLNYFSTYTLLQDAILGAIIGYSLLRGVYEVFLRITGKEGMGFGDFTLLALVGAWFGWQAVLFTVLFSTVSGSIIGMIILYKNKLGKETTLPFGPHLINACFLYLIAGKEIIHWYLGYL